MTNHRIAILGTRSKFRGWFFYALKREIDQIRYKIIRFSKELRYGDKKSQDEYNHIFQSIDKYHTLLERVQLENGQIDIESKYIRTHYLEKLQQNDFIE